MTGKRQLWVNLMVFLSLMLLPFRAVSAQEGPFQVFFNPDPAYLNIDEGINTNVTVNLANAVDIYSFTIIVEYDESVATLIDYEYFDLFGGINCPYQVNDPGRFAIGCTSWEGTSFYGDAPLLSLTFERVAIGTTPLTFTRATFSNSVPEPINPVALDNGELNVVGTFNLLYLPLIVNTMEG